MRGNCINCKFAQCPVFGDDSSPCATCFVQDGHPGWVSAILPEEPVEPKQPKKRSQYRMAPRSVQEYDMLQKYRKKYQQLKRMWRRVDSELCAGGHYASKSLADAVEAFEDEFTMLGRPKRVKRILHKQGRLKMKK